MKKLLLSLSLALFIGTVSATVYAINNTTTVELKNDHEHDGKKCDKKDCKKKGDCCKKMEADGKTCTAEHKTCDSKTAANGKTCSGDQKASCCSKSAEAGKTCTHQETPKK